MLTLAYLPAQQALLFTMFHTIKIDCVVFHACFRSSEKADLAKRFNKEDSSMTLIDTFAAISCGLDMQKRNYLGCLLGPNPSQAYRLKVSKLWREPFESARSTRCVEHLCYGRDLQ